MSRQRRAGFTLVEIMITVAIIGLLATIAIPSFLNARTSSQKNVCISHLSQIDGAKDQYALQHDGVAPAVLGDLIPGIIRRTPGCPAGGSYTMGALGEDPSCSRSALGHTI